MDLGGEGGVIQYPGDVGIVKISLPGYASVLSVYFLLSAIYIVLLQYCMYDHHLKRSMNQPGKVANPARRQLNRGK